MRTPRSVDVDLTARCNLRCAYCYNATSPAVGSGDLATEEWLEFFEELGRLAVMQVHLGGGEALLREDLPTLLDGIVRHRMRWSMVSNGTLFDHDMARFMARDGRCDYVQISIDGSCAPVHDSCRGAGSFDAALAGIRVLLAHRLPVTVRVTVHRHNVHDLEATAALLLDELGLPGFSVNSAGSLGACREHEREIALGIADRELAMASLDRLAARYPGRITAQAGPLAEVRRWREMERALQEGAEPFPDGGRLTGCGCVFNSIAVRADGVVVPCTMLPELELGRINRDPLDELWRSSPTLEGMRARQDIELASFAFCAGCRYTPYCTGNCPALAVAEVGELDHPSPDACLRRFLAAGGSLPPSDESVAAVAGAR